MDLEYLSNGILKMYVLKTTFTILQTTLLLIANLTKVKSCLHHKVFK